MLAQQWAMHGHWFCSLWLESGGSDAYAYSETDVARYEPSDAWQDWAVSQDAASATWPKIEQVSVFVPSVFKSCTVLIG